MNLFDKIKDAFSNEDEKRAQAEAAQAAQEQAAAYTPEAEVPAYAPDPQTIANEAAAAEAAAAEAAAQEAAAAADAERIANEVAGIEAKRVAEEQAAAAAAAAAAAPVDSRPALSVAYVLSLINHDADPNTATGNALDAGTGLTVENALAQVIDYSGPIDGALGTSFINGYARFQESLGYSGADADGYPGLASLTVLGDRTGLFRAVD